MEGAVQIKPFNPFNSFSINFMDFIIWFIEFMKLWAEWSLLCWGLWAGRPSAQPNFHSKEIPFFSISAVFAINQLY